MLKGIAASPGIGVGHAVLIEDQEQVVCRSPVDDVTVEQGRFIKAIGEFCTYALLKYHSVRERLGEQEASIISAQVVMVTDPELHGEIISIITHERVCAEYAVSSILEQYRALFDKMEDPLMRARGADFTDIRLQLLALLKNQPQQSLLSMPRGSILIARDIMPSLAVTIDPDRVVAIATQEGSCLSHICCIARALNIPAIVGIDQLLSRVGDGDQLVVDANRGIVMYEASARRLPKRTHPTGSVSLMATHAHSGIHRSTHGVLA